MRTDPPSNPITSYAFNPDAIQPIANALGAELDRAPFQLPGATVYQLTVEGADGRPATMVTLWPSISRVDAVSNGAVAVFTKVDSVDTVGTVEVQFRRGSGELLIIARGGKVIVRA